AQGQAERPSLCWRPLGACMGNVRFFRHLFSFPLCAGLFFPGYGQPSAGRWGPTPTLTARARPSILSLSAAPHAPPGSAVSPLLNRTTPVVPIL
ncbi:MAG: hypothetical protein LBT60_04680, partial [Oscillospiraceae bacterium]|nr:hypothetical protein [Oscillospiraceae bacterium]